MIPFTSNSRKYKLTYRDKKQITACLGPGPERWTAKQHKKLLEVMKIF